VFKRAINKLEKEIKVKKRKQLFRSKNQDKIYAIDQITYRGLKICFIMGSSLGFDIVFNSSPIDEGLVEYIRISSTGVPMLYSQHVFDRYNERACEGQFTTHKEIMKQLFINNMKKAPIKNSGDGDIIQRLNEGFLFGKDDEKHGCFIFNTFYDNEEYKDNFEKDSARQAKYKLDELSKEQVKQYDILGYKLQKGILTHEEFTTELKQIGII
jgi:hypothetical protein